MPEKARAIYEELRRVIPAEFDEGGSIGKRYRRQDEIGTPWGITIDGQTMEDDTVTLRDRDSLEQVRVPAAALAEELLRRLHLDWRTPEARRSEDRRRPRGATSTTCCRCWGRTAQFYEVDPAGRSCDALVRALLRAPGRGRAVHRARRRGRAAGFATVYWTWSTLVGDRIGVLHDLYVRPEHRRHGVGRALIDACLERARERGVARLGWDTAPDNAAAQRLYDSLPDVDAQRMGGLLAATSEVMSNQNVEIVRRHLRGLGQREQIPGPLELLGRRHRVREPRGAIEPGTRSGVAEFTRAMEKMLEAVGGSGRPSPRR